MNDIESAIKHLRELNEPVPRPLSLPNEIEVKKWETELGILLPVDYRTYLLKASDVVLGSIEPGTIGDPLSHTHLPKIIQSARTYGVPENLLPFCEDNGDFYCLTSHGEIVFWSHNGISDESWPNLADWIEQVWIGENT